LNKLTLKPSGFVETAGIPSERNLTVKNAEFTYWDYNGKTGATTVLKLVLIDDEGAEFVQYYSAGSPERICPSPDGKSLGAVGDAIGITNTSNLSIFIESLVRAGFPENKLGDDITVIIGLRFYAIAQDQPKRTGIKGKQSDFGKVILVVSKVLQMPWEKKPVFEVASETNDRVCIDKTVAYIKRLAMAAGGSISANEIGAAMYIDPEITADPDQKKIAFMALGSEVKDALSANGFTFEGENYIAPN
jgi:RNase P/RNase MRP subunit p29